MPSEDGTANVLAKRRFFKLNAGAEAVVSQAPGFWRARMCI